MAASSTNSSKNENTNENTTTIPYNVNKKFYMENVIQSVEQLLAVAGMHNGRVFGDFIKNVLYPRASNTDVNYDWPDIGVKMWFNSSVDAKAFVDTLNKNHQTTILVETTPELQQKYILACQDTQYNPDGNHEYCTTPTIDLYRNDEDCVKSTNYMFIEHGTFLTYIDITVSDVFPCVYFTTELYSAILKSNRYHYVEHIQHPPHVSSVVNVNSIKNVPLFDLKQVDIFKSPYQKYGSYIGAPNHQSNVDYIYDAYTSKGWNMLINVENSICHLILHHSDKSTIDKWLRQIDDKISVPIQTHRIASSCMNNTPTTDNHQQLVPNELSCCTSVNPSVQQIDNHQQLLPKELSCCTSVNTSVQQIDCAPACSTSTDPSSTSVKQLITPEMVQDLIVNAARSEAYIAGPYIMNYHLSKNRLINNITSIDLFFADWEHADAFVRKMDKSMERIVDFCQYTFDTTSYSYGNIMVNVNTNCKFDRWCSISALYKINYIKGDIEFALIFTGETTSILDVQRRAFILQKNAIMTPQYASLCGNPHTGGHYCQKLIDHYINRGWSITLPDGNIINKVRHGSITAVFLACLKSTDNVAKPFKKYHHSYTNVLNYIANRDKYPSVIIDKPDIASNSDIIENINKILKYQEEKMNNKQPDLYPVANQLSGLVNEMKDIIDDIKHMRI